MQNNFEIIRGGVTAAKGFYAAGAEAGIKYKNRKDMALVYTKEPAHVAGTFTKNVVKAAPVLWDMDIVNGGGDVHAVVLNSGIANACTGDEGKELNEWLAAETASVLGVEKSEVCTASTGVIGMQLVKEPMEYGIKLLCESLGDDEASGTKAAEAIMTTDTVSKEAAVKVIIGGKTITIGGMSKGSGMIHPNMATMLCVITTDACIEKDTLKKAASEIVVDSFNMISVDRDTSTNDTMLVLANGMAENDKIAYGTPEYEEFKTGLYTVAVTLAKKMAADGECASKLFETVVTGAKTKEEARILAKSVITSNLVKTAVYGSDANWGRILCALGYSGVEFDPYKVDLFIRCSNRYITDGGENENGASDDMFVELQLVKDGQATGYSEEFATKILSADVVTAVCDMKQGDESATAWGCDLTSEYVRINGDYRS